MFLEKDSLRHLFWIIEKNKVKHLILMIYQAGCLQAVPPARILPGHPGSGGANRG